MHHDFFVPFRGFDHHQVEFFAGVLARGNRAKGVLILGCCGLGLVRIVAGKDDFHGRGCDRSLDLAYVERDLKVLPPEGADLGLATDFNDRA